MLKKDLAGIDLRTADLILPHG